MIKESRYNTKRRRFPTTTRAEQGNQFPFSIDKFKSLNNDAYYHRSYLHLLILQMTYLSPYEIEAKPNVFSIAIIIPIVTNIKITDNAETDGS